MPIDKPFYFFQHLLNQFYSALQILALLIALCLELRSPSYLPMDFYFSNDKLHKIFFGSCYKERFFNAFSVFLLTREP